MVSKYAAKAVASNGIKNGASTIATGGNYQHNTVPVSAAPETLNTRFLYWNELIKTAGEKFLATMDFSETVGTATISSPTVTATPTGLTITEITVVDKVVTFYVEGGTAGTSYRFDVQITTSGGDTIVGYGSLKVIAD
jgi:hypothetical protein